MSCQFPGCSQPGIQFDPPWGGKLASGASGAVAAATGRQNPMRRIMKRGMARMADITARQMGGA